MVDIKVRSSFDITDSRIRNLEYPVLEACELAVDDSVFCVSEYGSPFVFDSKRCVSEFSCSAVIDVKL